MPKVSIFDKRIIKKSSVYISIIAGSLSFMLLFNVLKGFFDTYNLQILLGLIFVFVVVHLYIWIQSNCLKKIKLKIDGSNILIKLGDIFVEDDFKVIAFNEYFDTIVDNNIISEQSLNGIFIKEKLTVSVDKLNDLIISKTDEEDVIEENVVRKKGGKTTRFKLGTSVVCDDYILTAFSKFSDNNRAELTMTEYFNFLIVFWDKINILYAQKSVSVPIFGSGITRIKEHKGISDEELLKIMLWTFKLSEYRFKYPAKLTIVIHKDKLKNINLFDLKLLEKGF